MHVVTSCTLKSAEKRFKLTEPENSRSVAGMKTRTLANTPPPASGFALFHEGGNIRALDANGKVHRLRPERGTPVYAAAAAATINPTGADNSVTWTAASVGLAGNDISVTYATPAASAETVVSAVGNDVTVTPGTKARMVVTGTLSPDATGTLVYAGEDIALSWSSDGAMTAPESGDWVILRLQPDGTGVLEHWTDGSRDGLWISSDTGDWPDGLTYVADDAETGTPTVTAGISSAQQVIDASALSFVTQTASGTVTGAVAAVARTVLTGGVDATEGAAGDQMFDDDNRYLAISDVRKSSTSGWITEPYPS